MKMKRNAFTLIELLVSITILSILILFLYKSYANLNKTNKVYDQEVQKLRTISRFKETFYLDLLLASKASVIIIHQNIKFDFVSFSTTHSLHRLIKPYVAYIVKNGILYRLESNKEIVSPQISIRQQFIVDKIGKVRKFKLFKSKDANSIFLLEVDLKKIPPILIKVKALNS